MAKEKDPLFLEVGARIRAAMAAAHVPGNPGLAKLLSAEESRIRNWTNGTSMPPLKEGMRVCHALGITLDYLYRGEITGVPPGQGVRLRMAEAGLPLPEMPTRESVESAEAALSALGPAEGTSVPQRSRAKAHGHAR